MEKYFDEAYLIAYLPFRANLKSAKSNLTTLPCSKPITKLLLKSIVNTIDEHVAFYNLDLKTYIKDKKNYEEVFYNHLTKSINKKYKINLSSDVTIDSVDFSIYDDLGEQELGFFKVTIKVEFKKKYSDNIKADSISFLYDVLSRNVKQKFNEKTDNLKLNLDYRNLSNLFTKFNIEWVNKDNKFVQIIESENSTDWVFNYPHEERKCYSFAFFTNKGDINKYNDKHLKQNMYKIARPHENGAIRTFNVDNDIFDVYHDDTSVIWGVSRVGLGGISVEEKQDGRDRNVKILRADFSFIYEFCLHQKFFSYLMIDNNSRKNKYLPLVLKVKHRRENLTSFINTYCPKIISEFETQDVYELIRKNMEIDELLLDANSSVTNYENSLNRKTSARNVVISLLISVLVFPFTVFEIHKNNADAFNLFGLKMFLSLVIIGVVFWIAVYFLTGRTDK